VVVGVALATLTFAFMLSIPDHVYGHVETEDLVRGMRRAGLRQAGATK
jgi:hypothetical protein